MEAIRPLGHVRRGLNGRPVLKQTGRLPGEAGVIPSMKPSDTFVAQPDAFSVSF